MLSVLVNILLFILVIGFLTLIHEMGHFLAAKAIGAKVYEFSLGFGPKLISKKFKGTEYCIRVIPLGGFVKILGDGDPGDYGEEKLKGSKENLKNKSKFKQIFVMLAGVTMNILFAVIFYYIFLGINSWKTSPIYIEMSESDVVGVKLEKLVGYEAISEGNADKAGLPKYGFFKKIDGVQISDRKEISELIKGKEILSVLACDDKEEECKEYIIPVTEDKIGVYVSNGFVYNYEDFKLWAGFSYVFNNIKLVSKVLGSMINTAQESGDYSDLSNTVSGPVGIFLLIDNLKYKGVVVFLSMVADLSLSLAIMNILPIPALDGGRVLILFLEGILRRDLDDRIEAIIINTSMIFLIVLVIALMVKDIVNIDDMRNMLG